MKRKFTLITAALALLTMVVQPLKTVGQTKTTTTLFEETFNDCNGTGGDTGTWTNGNPSGDIIADNDGWTFTKGSKANKCAKFGTGSAKGSAVTPTISFIGDAVLTFNAAAWSGTSEGTTLNLSATGGTLNLSSVTLTKGAWNTYTVNITNVTTGVQITFIAANSSNNRFFLDEVKITQESGGGGSTLEESDLAITGAPVALNFDLYNNASAQTVSYTTSSTGAITITPNTPNTYFSYEHNAGTKTISVTPLAVTPSAQTVTISQEADATYQAKSVSFTVSVANSDPTIPGTLTNPYTVAQAIENTPSSGTSANVYVHGIVSAFYGSNTNITTDTYHRYYISDDGTTTNQLLVYNGKGLNNVAFSNADDLLVGDEVTILGGLTTYNDTEEIAADNYIVTLVRKVATPTFSPAAGAVVSGTEVTISSATDGATIYYTIDGSNPTTTSSVYSAPITITTATTIKAYAVKDSYADSEIATAAYTIATPVATPTFLPAAGTYSINQNVEILCETGGATIYYTTNGSNPTTSSTEYTEPIEVTADKTIKAIAVKAGMINSEIATASYTFVAALPFNFNGGKADIANTKGLTQDGLGSDYSSSTVAKLKFDNTGDWLQLYFNERPGTLTFKMTNNGFSGSTFKVQTSEDGVNFTDLKTYTSISGTQTEEFTTLGENVRYIKWIYTEKSSGNVGLGSIALAKYVAPQPSITVNPTSVNVLATGGYPEFAVTYENMVITDEGDFAVKFFESDGTTPLASQPSWITDYEFNPGATEGYELMVEVDENTDVQRVAYLKVFAYDDVTPVYSELITITQAAPAAPAATYTLVTDIDDLISGQHYIIAAVKDATTYAMGTAGTNNRPGVAVTVESTTITGNDDVCEVVIIGPDAGGFYSLYDVANDGYLYAASSGSNYLKSQKPNNDNGRWAITFDEGKANIVAQGSNTRNIMRFNPNGSNTPIFSCYSSGQQPIYLYAKYGETPISYYTTINAYTNNSNGWYLIAPPVGQVDPTTSNFLANTHDLYAFDQSETNEWRNYKQNTFNLVSGHGYLYANSNTVELTFTGMPYAGNGQVFLAYDGDAELKGYNLIGNPFNTNATVNKEFYRMNETHDGIIVDPVAANGTVAAMEGIFVVATEAGQSVTFTPASQNAPAPSNQLVMNLSYNTRGSAIDRAIVRFGEGNQLPKFQLFENSTKVYIPQNGKDYAVVRSEAQGELPINFKAEKNGSYTLSFEAENVEMNYLHLIDNLTGADIDLLQTPSYTFNGKTTDYASRFRLVFSANNVNDNQEGNTNFAYINGEEIVILNAEANATLQVVDLTGRIVSSTNVAHSVSTAGMVPGVYVLRLINGTDVKVQKIVVE